jgi:hypothetical protein
MEYREKGKISLTGDELMWVFCLMEKHNIILSIDPAKAAGASLY